MWICGADRRFSWAGMTFVLPLLIIATIAASPNPWSQTLSVRFGAPMAGLPLPSGPWQAAQTTNLLWPAAAATTLRNRLTLSTTLAIVVLAAAIAVRVPAALAATGCAALAFSAAREDTWRDRSTAQRT